MPSSTAGLPFPELAILLAVTIACVACGDQHNARDDDDADGSQSAPSDGGNKDGGSVIPMDAGDAGITAPDGSSAQPDGQAPDSASAPGADAAPADAGADAGGTEAGPCTPGVGACPGDSLAPFKLDCANLPANGVCVGGPREVLLVIEETGMVAMFDPSDGHFLGYFKRRSAKYNVNNVKDYHLADQGPDQCIWTASGDDEGLIERWNTDGTYRDVPLKPHYFDLPGGAPEPLQDVTSIAFSRDKVYVTTDVATPGYPEITRWGLDGSFDRVELDGEYAIQSLLVLGDGSIAYGDQNMSRIARIPAGGGQHRPILGQVNSVAQIAYAGAGDLLVVNGSSGEPLYRVGIESGMAKSIYPTDTSQTGKFGIALLKNGKWLMTSGAHDVSALDPASVNPPGQHVSVFSDPAAESSDFQHVGRACLPEAFVASRASKPADNTCIAPPDGATLFEAKFEGTDDYQGTGTARHYREFYDRGAVGVASSIAAGEGFDGSRALKIVGSGTLTSGTGALQRSKTGVYAMLPAGSHPKYVSYRVKIPNAPNQELGSFQLHNAALNTDGSERLMGADFYNGYLRDLQSDGASEGQLFNAWVKIEFRNIDWAKRTTDVYVNCQRLTEGTALPAGYGDSVDSLDLFNFPGSAANAQTVASYDDILIK